MVHSGYIQEEFSCFNTFKYHKAKCRLMNVGMSMWHNTMQEYSAGMIFNAFIKERIFQCPQHWPLNWQAN